MNALIVAVLCVLGMTIGQILFKLSATSLARTGSFFALETAATLFAAMVLYGITTIAWGLGAAKSRTGARISVDGTGICPRSAGQSSYVWRAIPATVLRGCGIDHG